MFAVVTDEDFAFRLQPPEEGPKKCRFLMNVQKGVTAVDNIKCTVSICLFSAVSNFKLNRAFESNSTLKSKRNHIYGEVNSHTLNVKVLSHVKVTSTNTTTNI
uniref:Phosphomethylethanolamine N-methyltransferase-like n=1 Tax=Rhizophora mucronata TaxID=61149 RepID=A0A2P2JXC8_RHIMU